MAAPPCPVCASTRDAAAIAVAAAPVASMSRRVESIMDVLLPYPPTVIPGCVRKHAGPESITTAGGYGFRARRSAAPRNDDGRDHAFAGSPILSCVIVSKS